MSLSHTEARLLIQTSLDRPLKAQEQEGLDGHIQSCAECQTYTADMDELELVLQSVMSAQWSHIPMPLVHKDLLASRQNLKFTRLVQAATIGAFFFFLVFGTWRFTLINSPSMVTPITMEAAPIPTPMTLTTISNTTIVECKNSTYITQPGDTVESISARFSIPARELIEVNKLPTDRLSIGVTLVIPLCDKDTPTATYSPTITFLPNTALTAYTP